MGQWRLEIEDEGRDVLRRERFYVGPALNIIDPNPAERWNHATVSLESAAAVLLNHDVDIEISNELGIKKTVYKRLKILTAAGKSNNEFYESYKEKQFPRIKFAHSVLPDGTIQADAQQFPGVLQRVPPHHRSARVMFVRMLRAETGDVLEFEMTFEEPFVFGEDLIYDEYFVRSAVPVLNARYTVSYPADMDLEYQVNGSDLKPDITPSRASAKKRMQWTWQSVPALTPEEAMPPYRAVAESVVISTARDWSDVAEEWRRHTVNKYKVNDELKDLLRRILLESKTVEEKIAAIYKYVKYKVDFGGFDFGWSNPEPLPSVGTLKNKKGDAKDQAVLLKTFLNEAGIAADVALVRTRDVGPPDDQAVGLGEFNHVMVVARDGDKKFFLDPSRPYYRGWNLPARNWGATALVIEDDAVQLLTVPAQEDNGQQEVETDLVMGTDFVVTGTLRIEYFGREGARIKNDLNTWNQNQTLDYVRGQVGAAVPAGNFTQVEVFNQKKIGRNARLEAQVQTTRPWLAGEGPWTIQLADALEIRPEYVTENRQHAVHLIGRHKRHITSRLTLPEALAVNELPPAYTCDNPFLECQVGFRQEHTTLILEVTIEEKKTDISLKEYPAFRQAYEEAIAAISAGITLVPGSQAAIPASGDDSPDSSGSVQKSPAS